MTDLQYCVRRGCVSDGNQSAGNRFTTENQTSDSSSVKSWGHLGRSIVWRADGDAISKDAIDFRPRFACAIRHPKTRILTVLRKSGPGRFGAPSGPELDTPPPALACSVPALMYRSGDDLAHGLFHGWFGSSGVPSAFAPLTISLPSRLRLPPDRSLICASWLPQRVRRLDSTSAGVGRSLLGLVSMWSQVRRYVGVWQPDTTQRHPSRSWQARFMLSQ